MCVTFVTCEVRVCGPRCHSGSSLYIYRVYCSQNGAPHGRGLSTCPAATQALMGAAHYLPTVGTPLLIKPLHRPHPTPRHLLCCPLATNPHAVSLRPAGRT